MIIEIDFKKIGLNIENFRKSFNLQFEELSNKTGINRRRLRTIEKGSKTIKLIEIVSICNQLNAKIEDILVYKVTY